MKLTLRQIIHIDFNLLRTVIEYSIKIVHLPSREIHHKVIAIVVISTILTKGMPNSPILPWCIIRNNCIWSSISSLVTTIIVEWARHEMSMNLIYSSICVNILSACPQCSINSTDMITISTRTICTSPTYTNLTIHLIGSPAPCMRLSRLIIMILIFIVLFVAPMYSLI